MTYLTMIKFRFWTHLQINDVGWRNVNPRVQVLLILNVSSVFYKVIYGREYTVADWTLRVKLVLGSLQQIHHLQRGFPQRERVYGLGGYRVWRGWDRVQLGARVGSWAPGAGSAESGHSRPAVERGWMWFEPDGPLRRPGLIDTLVGTYPIPVTF